MLTQSKSSKLQKIRQLLQFSNCFLVILYLINAAVAQDNRPANDQKSALTITASATSERVRFTAPSSVVQIRLEVYNSAGSKLFDNEIRGGNVLDWHIQDGQAEHLADGSYLCVVSVKSLSGRIAQRLGSVMIEKTAGASVQPLSASEMTAQQAQAVGPVEEDSLLSVLKEDQKQTTTVIAHNGEDGQITRGRGGLSFRIGDFFSGKDTEQMRLTPEGNVGIGITHPKARLDVEGLIRTSQGILFPDGTIQSSAANSATTNNGGTQTQAGGKKAGKRSVRPAIAGTGTQNVVSKWTDGDGTLGDSAISEVGGNVGIGTSTPGFKLEVNTSTGVIGSYGFVHSNTFFGPKGVQVTSRLGTLADLSGIGFGTLTNDPLNLFVNNGLTSLTVDTTGNVGIGTVTPAVKLHVEGPGYAETRIRSTNERAILSLESNLGGQPRVWTVESGLFGTRGLFGIYDRTAGVSRLNIDTAGNVGIGTVTPAVNLHVEGPGYAETRIRSTNERAILSLESNLPGQNRVWTIESGLFGTPGLFGIYDRTAGVSRLTIDTAGNVGVNVLQITGGSDLAEHFEVVKGARPGMLVAIDTQNAGKLTLARGAYNRHVAGIISGAKNLSAGLVLPDPSGTKSSMPIALTGRVWAYCDATENPITPGDLLTTSATAGHAMKVVNYAKAKGAVIGKAMTGLKSGKGLVLVLVTLQ